MSPHRIAYILLGSFLLTAFCLQWSEQISGDAGIILILATGILVSSVASLLPRYRTLAVIVTIGSIGVSAAFLAVKRVAHMPTSQTIDYYADGEWVEIRGKIVDEPDRRPLSIKYAIEAEELKLRGTGGMIAVGGRVLATDRRGWPRYEYGDDVVVRGDLERPGQIEAFHYDRYLSRYGIYSVIYQASLEKATDARHQNLLGTLFSIKQRFEEQINRLLPEPHASFMAGLLTGSRRGIPEDLLTMFNTVGLTHIIAISGYNITIIIAVITGLLFWLPLKLRFVPAVAAIIAFTIFVGASAAVVRAAIMGILGLLALQVGRQYDVRLAILWTLGFMVAWNPRMLWYDAGFQLSFLAVLGLTELSGILDRLFTHIPSILGIREALQMTIAAQLFAVPLIIPLFGRLSLIAPIANLLVAPFVPLAMLFGFLGTIVSWIFFPLGQILMYLGWGCLEWILRVTEVLASLPLASVDMPNMKLWLIVLYYIILVGWIAYVQLRGRTKH